MKMELSKTLFKLEHLENASFSVLFGRKRFGKRSFSKTLTSELPVNLYPLEVT